MAAQDLASALTALSGPFSDAVEGFSSTTLKWLAARDCGSDPESQQLVFGSEIYVFKSLLLSQLRMASQWADNYFP